MVIYWSCSAQLISSDIDFFNPLNFRAHYAADPNNILYTRPKIMSLHYNRIVPHCLSLSTTLNNIVEPESGVTMLFNVVNNLEQCGQHNIVQSCS